MNKRNKIKKEKDKEVNILSFFYFILIFCVVIYLFFALFGRATPYNNVGGELSLFDVDSVKHNDVLIMDFPDFLIPKRR